MYHLGLIGKSLLHSFSPQYFQKKFLKEGIDHVKYQLFEIEQISDVVKVFDMPNLVGLNVTVPYKTEIIPYLDVIDADAEKIGAINCIVIENGIKKGYNTDWLGFSESISPLLKSHHQKALILGSGGASKAICYSFHKMGIETKIVSSGANHDYTYDQLNEDIIQSFQIIVNCTPIGMFPKTEESPIGLNNVFKSYQLCYDVIYNPLKTKFLIQASQEGAEIKNGLEMLEIQADLSWQKWHILCDY